jgi:hypothetical protein
MRTFALQTEPVAGLEELGQCELREVPAGPLRLLMGHCHTHDLDLTFSVLAASLHVDGEPIGLERLDALPARFLGPLQPVIQACIAMHDVGGRRSADDTDGAPPSGEA